MLASTNFNEEKEILKFINRILEELREFEGKPNNIHEQLTKGATTFDLYNFLFSLKFLKPIYKLTWEGKRIEQLSPGERGNLLLVFYLIVDNGLIPIVLDQPEENLDNQTVYRTLVPCILEAKKHRQIIMVTHNPNLAVVCDAEQVIYAEMDKENNSSINYISGSIEDPYMNQKIMDVLEGTRPAFDKRGNKYF